MRILVLTSVYPPLGYSGHDERCRQTVHALSRRGHQLQVLTSDHRLPPMGVTGEKGVFRELRLHPDPEEDALLGNSYGATYAHERFNAEALEYRVRRFRPDTVYVWNMRNLSKSLLFRLQDKGVKVVYDLHADWMIPEVFNQDPWYRWWFDNTSKRSWLYRILMRSIGRARRVLGMMPIDGSQKLDFSSSYFVSHWQKQAMLEAGCTHLEKLPVHYPGVHSGSFSPKTRYTARRRFMWAGRLSQHKGADVALEAVELLKERGIELTLDIFGMGEPSERKAKRERIEQAGLSEQVRMRGIRPGELGEYYGRYDALLYTHRSGEPFSMTVLEAMYAGLPCIVANAGGSAELLQDGENALLFEAGSSVALADTLEQFLQREDVGASLAQSMIERLQTEFTADSFCQRIESVLAAGSSAEGPHSQT